MAYTILTSSTLLSSSSSSSSDWYVYSVEISKACRHTNPHSYRREVSFANPLLLLLLLLLGLYFLKNNLKVLVEHLATKYEEDLKRLGEEIPTFKGILEKHEKNQEYNENKDKSLTDNT